MHPSGPWRNVVSVEVDESNGRRWKMLLECGHTAWRPVSYRPLGVYQPKAQQRPRLLNELSPDPVRSRCWECGRAETAASCDNRQWGQGTDD